jgi:hypothetical protein
MQTLENVPDFQAEYEGSIPFTRSNVLRRRTAAHQTQDALAMQARIDAHEITTLFRNRAGSFGIRRCRGAG